MGKFIHNATFMMEPARVEEFVGWFKPLAVNAGKEYEPRLSRLRYVGGEESDAQEGAAASVAYQVEFDRLDDAVLWGEKILRILQAQFERKFEGMVFSSIFEEITLG